MAKNRFFYLCALLGCFGFYIAYAQWLGWLLLVGILALPWLSLALSLPMLLTFRASVRGSGPVVQGQAARAELMGTARLLVLPFRGRLRLTRCNTAEQKFCPRDGQIPTEHCGGIRVEPEKVGVCDLLGLFRFRVRSPGMTTVLVRPKALPMGGIGELDRFLAHSWRPKAGGGFGENHEIRLYRPGDSPNQVHWKLTAKTGKLMIREPMVPDRGLVLLTLDINGTPQELDRKFGRLLWLGHRLLEKGVTFQVRALTGEGLFSAQVSTSQALLTCIDALLCCPPAAQGSILDRDPAAAWHRHLGGEPDAP